MNNPLDQYTTLTEAAKALGYSGHSALSRYLKEGRVPGAVRFGRSWLIPRAWLENELQNPSLPRYANRGGQRSKS